MCSKIQMRIKQYAFASYIKEQLFDHAIIWVLFVLPSCNKIKHKHRHAEEKLNESAHILYMETVCKIRMESQSWIYGNRTYGKV